MFGRPRPRRPLGQCGRYSKVNRLINRLFQYEKYKIIFNDPHLKLDNLLKWVRLDEILIFL